MIEIDTIQNKFNNGGTATHHVQQGTVPVPQCANIHLTKKPRTCNRTALLHPDEARQATLGDFNWKVETRDEKETRRKQEQVRDRAEMEEARTEEAERERERIERKREQTKERTRRYRERLREENPKPTKPAAQTVNEVSFRQSMGLLFANLKQVLCDSAAPQQIDSSD